MVPTGRRTSSGCAISPYMYIYRCVSIGHVNCRVKRTAVGNICSYIVAEHSWAVSRRPGRKRATRNTDWRCAPCDFILVPIYVSHRKPERRRRNPLRLYCYRVCIWFLNVVIVLNDGDHPSIQRSLWHLNQTQIPSQCCANACNLHIWVMFLFPHVSIPIQKVRTQSSSHVSYVCVCVCE